MLLGNGVATPPATQRIGEGYASSIRRTRSAATTRHQHGGRVAAPAPSAWSMNRRQQRDCQRTASRSPEPWIPGTSRELTDEQLWALVCADPTVSNRQLAEAFGAPKSAAGALHLPPSVSAGRGQDAAPPTRPATLGGVERVMSGENSPRRELPWPLAPRRTHRPGPPQRTHTLRGFQTIRTRAGTHRHGRASRVAQHLSPLQAHTRHDSAIDTAHPRSQTASEGVACR